MPKQVISTNNAPAAVGAYSQGVSAGGFVYIAGRNDPCPCGSGLKFKRCHGRRRI